MTSEETSLATHLFCGPRAHSCEVKVTWQTFARSSGPAAPQTPAGSVWRLIPILAFAQGRFENVLTSKSLDTTRIWPDGVSYVSSFFPESQTFWMRKKFFSTIIGGRNNIGRERYTFCLACKGHPWDLLGMTRKSNPFFRLDTKPAAWFWL